jgi:hypothetical protein
VPTLLEQLSQDRAAPRATEGRERSFGFYNIESLEKTVSNLDNPLVTQFSFDDFQVESNIYGEADVLEQYNVPVLTDYTINKDKYNILRESGLNVSPYMAEKSPDNIRLLHSKLISGTREGRGIARIDSSMFGTTRGKTGSLSSSKESVDIYYESSNPTLYKEVRQHQEALTRNELVVGFSGEYLKTGNAIFDSLYTDLLKAQGDVAIVSAGINAPNEKPSFSDIDVANASKQQLIINKLIERSGEGKVNILAASESDLAKTKLDEQLQQAGSSSIIGIAKSKNPHYNIFYLEDIDDKGTDVAYFGTRRFTPGSHEESMIRLTSKDDAEFLDFLKLAIANDYNFNPEAALLAYKGYTNTNLIASTTGDVVTQLPSNLGPSYFHSIARDNTAREWNPSTSFSSYVNRPGIATYNYLMNNQGATSVPGQIKDYDVALMTPGWGSIINEYFMSHGMGRIYKSELGALPSATGLIGALLDRTLTYYGGFLEHDPYRVKPINQEPKPGMYESALSNITSFAITTGIAITTYFSLGIPASFITSEITRLGLEEQLDNALNGTNNRTRVASSVLSLGYGDPDDLDNYITTWKQKHNISTSLLEGYYEEHFSLPFINNLLYRERGGIFFDKVTQPFLLGVVDPYEPSSELSIKYKDSIDSLSRTIRSPIELLEVREEGVLKRLIPTNVGFDRQKEIAKLVDEVASYVPINIFRWGWGNGNAKARDFISVAEVFSFTDIVNTFNQVVGASSRNAVSLSAASEVTVGGMSGLVQRAGNIISAATRATWTRIRTGNNLSFILGDSEVNIAGERLRLKKLENQMLAEGLLYWDPSDGGSRMIGNISGNAEEMARKQDLTRRFINQLVVYNEAIEGTTGYREAVQRATEYTASQANLFNQLSARNSRFLSNWFHRSKSSIATTFLVALNVHAGLTSILDASGPSLIRTIGMQLRNDVDDPRFNTRNVLLEGSLATAGYVAFSFAAGYAASHLFGSLTYERYRVDTNMIAAGKMASLTPEAANLMNRGVLRVRGKQLFAASAVTFALLSLPRLITTVGNTVFNALNRLTGTEGHVLNENYGFVASLEQYRQSVLERVQTGQLPEDVTDRSLEVWAAFSAGQLVSPMAIYRNINTSGSVKVYASQAPLNWLQFFAAETIQKKTASQKGVVSYSAGIQAAPVLGFSISLGLPISYDLDRNTIVYNQENNNIINSLRALGDIGNASILAFGTIAGFMNLAPYAMRLIKRDSSYIDSGAKSVTNELVTIARTIDTIGGNLGSIPVAGARIFKATFYDTHLSVLKATTRIVRAKRSKIDFAEVLLMGAGIALVGIFTNQIKYLFDPTEQFSYTPIDIALSLGGGMAGAVLFTKLLPPAWKESVDRIGGRIIKSLSTKELSIAKGAFSRIRLPRYPFLIAGLSALAMTTTGWGISEGMDADPLQRLGTIGLYTLAVGGAAVALGDMGLDPISTVEKYRRIKQRGLNMSEHNPLRFLQKIREAQLEGDIRSDFKSLSNYTREYLNNRSQYHSFQLLKDNLADENNLKAFNEAINEFNLRSNDVSNIFDYADGKVSLNKTGLSAVHLLDNRDYLRWRNARLEGPAGRRLFRAAMSYGVVAAAASAVMIGAGWLFGAGDDNAAVDRFYGAIDGTPFQFISDTFRLLTGKDVNVATNSIEPMLVQMDGTIKRRRGVRLIAPMDQQVNSITRAIGDLSNAMVFNATNPFLSVLIFGTSIREGEMGTRFSGYIQFQSANQDFNAAIYSTNSSFLYRLAGRGRIAAAWSRVNRQGRINDATYRNITDDQRRFLALSIVSLANQLEPLSDRNRRRISTPVSKEALALYRSDSLMNIALSERLKDIRRFSYRSLESLMMENTDLSNPQNIGLKDGGASPLALLFPNLSKTDRTLIENGNFSSLSSYLSNPLNGIKIDNTIRIVNSKARGYVGTAETGDWVDATRGSLAPPKLANPLSDMYQTMYHLMSRIPVIGSSNIAIMLGITTAMMVGGLYTFNAISAYTGRASGSSIDKVVTTLRHFWDDSSRPDFYVANVGTNAPTYEIKRGRFTYSIRPEGLDLASSNNFAQALSNFLNVDFKMTAKDHMSKLISNIYDNPLMNIDNYYDRNALVRDVKAGISLEVDTMLDGLFSKLRQTIISDNYSKPAYHAIGLDEELLTNIEQSYKKKVAEVIESTLEREIVGEIKGDRIARRFANLGRPEQIRLIVGSVLNELTPIFQQVKDKALILDIVSADPAMINQRDNTLMKWVKSLGGIADINRTEKARWRNIVRWNEGRIQLPALSKEVSTYSFFSNVRATRWDTLGTIWNIAGSAMTVVESIDIGGAYVRLGAAQRNDLYSEAEREMLEEYAGMVTRQSATGIAVGWGVSHTISKLGSGAMSLASKAGTKGGKIGALIGLAALAVAGAVFSIKALQSAMDNPGVKNFLDKSDQFFSTVDKGIGNVLGDVIPGLLSFGNNEVKGFLTGLMGGLLMGATLLGGVKAWFGKMVTGGTIGRGAVAGAAAIGLTTIHPDAHQGIARLSGSYLDYVSKMVGVGDFLVTPMDRLLQRYKTGPDGFQLALPNRSFQANAEMWYEASSDPSGSSTASILISPLVDGGGTGREPKRVIDNLDALTTREIKRRSRDFNSDVFGLSNWLKAVRGSNDWSKFKTFAYDKITGKYISNIKAIRNQEQVVVLALPDTAALARAVSQVARVPRPMEAQKVAIVPKQQFNPALHEQVVNNARQLGSLTLISKVTKSSANKEAAVITTAPDTDNAMWATFLHDKVSVKELAQRGYSLVT